jgi:hypothetical protein
MNCPECGHENRIGVLLCENCGNDLYDSLLGKATTKQLPDFDTRELAGDGGYSTQRPLVVYVSRDDIPLVIPRKDDLILGRTEGGAVADVDLTDFAAQEKGVSRQHLRLNAHHLPPSVVDLDSYNGTFINGQKLIPQQVYSLRSGDEIWLSKLVLRVYYK